ncbi:MAG: 4Fe-4S binding protein [Methanoregula sp.]|nr:4Fe-4S binding protein [Methanoregula sp.]
MTAVTEPQKERPEQTGKLPRGLTSLKVALIATAVTAVLLFVLTGNGWHDTGHKIFSVFFALFGAVVTFSILRSGLVNRYRLPIFLGSGIIFTIAFSIEHQLAHGTLLFNETAKTSGNVSICPITIPFTIPPLILENKMIFPATIAALLSILVLWLLLVLLFGRGWCGWFCFFGWMDQLSASILKKPLLRLDTVPRWAKLFPYAFVLLLILVSLIALSPVYCSKICPLRIFYDPPMVTTNAGWGLALIFIIGGFILFFAGPFLTKKRIQCSCFCPLIPANAIIGIVSPFRVRVDLDKCQKCNLCIKSCELFAITKESLEKGGTTIECAKCGKCIDACPQGALDYYLYTTSIRVRPWFIALSVAVSVMLLAGFAFTVATFLLTGTLPPGRL